MSFQQGLSGLNAASKNLEIIGNNVANANTFGAKSSRAEFGDMYAAALGGAGGSNIGIGVNLQAVTQQFSQGNITTTANGMDIAINGQGFFELQQNGQTLYSRNGQFQVNKEGFIVNNQGAQLLGYPADGQGVIQPGVASPLQLPTAGIDPSATTEISMELNLDSRAATTLPATTPQVNFSDAKTYNNATSLTVFDAKGQDVALTYYFQKTATDTWNVYVTANGTSVAVDGAGDPAPLTTINFPSNGGTPTSPSTPITLDIPASTNAAGAETLAISGIQLDMTGATQYGASFGVTDLKVPPGHLAVVEADRDLIADSGLFGGDPNMQPGLVNLSARSATAADGSSLTGSTGHNEYLLHGSTSQYNIAATVAGLPDRRIAGPNVDLDDFVLAGVRMHL
jgi:flagellar hook protein FlgE